MKIPGSKGFKLTMGIILGLLLVPTLVLVSIGFIDTLSTTDEEIIDRFCRRGPSTLEIRPEDEYCVHPDLYRQHIDNPSECLASKCKAL